MAVSQPVCVNAICHCSGCAEDSNWSTELYNLAQTNLSMPEYIYVLGLAHEKYYVGRTEDIPRQFREHLTINGTEWTRLHPPRAIVHYHECASPYDEDITTLEVMRQFGIDNVRGGEYSQTELSISDLMTIGDQIRSAQNDGPLALSTFRTPIVSQRPAPASAADTLPQIIAQSRSCIRCGRPGHYASACHARMHADGTFLDEAGRRVLSTDPSFGLHSPCRVTRCRPKPYRTPPIEAVHATTRDTDFYFFGDHCGETHDATVNFLFFIMLLLLF